MKGRSAGDKFTVQVPAKDGYGLRKEDSVQRVPVKHLIGQKKPKLGDVVTVNTKTRTTMEEVAHRHAHGPGGHQH